MAKRPKKLGWWKKLRLGLEIVDILMTLRNLWPAAQSRLERLRDDIWVLIRREEDAVATDPQATAFLYNVRRLEQIIKDIF